MEHEFVYIIFCITIVILLSHWLGNGAAGWCILLWMMLFGN
jgi:hypothetical protein